MARKIAAHTAVVMRADESHGRILALINRWKGRSTTAKDAAMTMIPTNCQNAARVMRSIAAIIIRVMRSIFSIFPATLVDFLENRD